jgi:hypothetical protein
VDPVPDPLLLIKSGSAGNLTRTSGSVDRNYRLEYSGGRLLTTTGHKDQGQSSETIRAEHWYLDYSAIHR